MDGVCGPTAAEPRYRCEEYKFNEAIVPEAVRTDGS